MIRKLTQFTESQMTKSELRAKQEDNSKKSSSKDSNVSEKSSVRKRLKLIKTRRKTNVFALNKSKKIHLEHLIKQTEPQNSSGQNSKKQSEELKDTVSVAENTTETESEDQLKGNKSQDNTRGGNSNVVRGRNQISGLIPALPTKKVDGEYLHRLTKMDLKQNLYLMNKTLHLRA